MNTEEQHDMNTEEQHDISAEEQHGNDGSMRGGGSDDDWFWFGIILIILIVFVGYPIMEAVHDANDQSEYAKVHEVEVLESASIIAFSVSGDQLTGATSQTTYALFSSKTEVDLEYEDEEGSESTRYYTIFADKDGDGGYTEEHYPVDETVVFPDADAQTARIEKVNVVTQRRVKDYDGEPIDRVTKEHEEYHLHIPADAAGALVGVATGATTNAEATADE